MSNFVVRKVAVLGAGVMGAQIAAHCVNARVPVVLFDLPAKEGPKNGIVLKAIENLKKLNPAPLGLKDDAQFIETANYDDGLELLKGCDVIIEAIAERLDWKHDLYRKIGPFVAPDATHVYYVYGLRIDPNELGVSRDRLLEALRAEGVPALRHRLRSRTPPAARGGGAVLQLLGGDAPLLGHLHGLLRAGAPLPPPRTRRPRPAPPPLPRRPRHRRHVRAVRHGAPLQHAPLAAA